MVLIDYAMRKLFHFIAPIAIAAIAFTSCQKEAETQTPEELGTVHITVKATPDALQGGTRTYINSSNTILWGTGEYMKIAVEAGENTAFGTSTDAAADLFDGESEALFEFDITPGEADSYSYMGLYPASAVVESNNTNTASYKVNLISTQNATASSYDPAAYIMVAKPEEFTSVQDEWEASYRRATALNKVTLTGLTEDIKRVKITAPAGVSLTGRRNINLTTGESGNIYDGSESVEVKYASSLAGGSDMVIWFTTWDATIPVDAKLTIVAYSAKHTFTREITVVNNPITFKEGYLNTLSVNMARAVQGNNTELEAGDYVILAKNNDAYYALKAAAEGTRMAYEDYTGSTTSYRGKSAIIWTVAKSGDNYTIANGGKYLGWSSGNTAAFNDPGDGWTTDNYDMDITWVESSSSWKVSVHSASKRVLAKNTDAKYGFGFYEGTGYNSLLFVPAIVDEREELTLSFDNDEVNLTTANFSGFEGQTATPSVEGKTVTYSWDADESFGMIDESDGTIVLAGTVGSAVVTASFAGDNDYLPAEASYSITVIPAITNGWLETALTDITAGDVFVIVGNDMYAIANDEKTSAGPSPVSVTVSSSSMPASLTGKIASNIKWTLTGDATNGYTFYSNANSSNYLYCSTTATSGSNDNIRVGASGSRKVFVLENGHLKTKDTNTARYIGINGTTDFRGYTDSNTNSVTFKFYKLFESRQDPGMSWSASAATASIETGTSGVAISFTAPTLTPGNATDINYNSTNPAVATISSAGEVDILAEGTTTIQAIFDGDDDYRDAIAEYTLTVNDNRETVATPTFSPTGGTFDSATSVTISCATTGATIHYTTNGDDPTSSSPAYSAPISVGESMTIKAIAVKNGYKDSSVATANYTIGGGSPATSTLTFTAACGGSGTADDGAAWTISSDADESTFDNTKGIHYGTSKKAVSYLTLSTSDISGTITKIVVNASGASGTSAKLNVTVGGSAFGSEQSLTSSAANYTLTGSASGGIVVSLTQASATKALYVKSVVVTYNNPSGGGTE